MLCLSLILFFVAVSSSDTTSSRRLQQSAASLVYYGGPILGRPKIYPIFYNSEVLYQDQIFQYYKAIVSGGDFLAFLNIEYGSSTPITNGTVDNPYVISQTMTVQSDDQIRTIITNLFAADPWILPSPTDNSYYVVCILHFPFPMIYTENINA